MSLPNPPRTSDMATDTIINDAEAFRHWLEAPVSTHAELLDLCAIGFVSSRESEEPHRQLLAARQAGIGA